MNNVVRITWCLGIASTAILGSAALFCWRPMKERWHLAAFGNGDLPFASRVYAVKQLLSMESPRVMRRAVELMAVERDLSAAEQAERSRRVLLALRSKYGADERWSPAHLGETAESGTPRPARTIDVLTSAFGYADTWDRYASFCVPGLRRAIGSGSPAARRKAILLLRHFQEHTLDAAAELLLGMQDPDEKLQAESTRVLWESALRLREQRTHVEPFKTLTLQEFAVCTNCPSSALLSAIRAVLASPSEEARGQAQMLLEIVNIDAAGPSGPLRTNRPAEARDPSRDPSRPPRPNRPAEAGPTSPNGL